MIELLYDSFAGTETASAAEAGTAAERLYGGPLRLEGGSPHVFANFVSTLDGVVSLGLGDGTDSSVISARHPADRFMLGFLRAAAEIVLIGAGTLAASPGHRWWYSTPAVEWKQELAAFRGARGLDDAQPRLVVVSGSGALPDHPALREQAPAPLVITTPDGASRLRKDRAGLAVHVAGPAPFTAQSILEALAATGARWVLCEGGPTLLGRLLAGDAVHDLFLSLSPAVAGRDPARPRPGLVAGTAFSASALHHAELRSVRRSGDLLLLHHRLS